MLRSLCLIVTLLGVPQERVSRAPAAPPEIPPGYVEINGAKSPNSIPEWLAWTSTMRNIALATANPDSIFIGELKLRPEERTVVFDAARRLVDKEAACESRKLAMFERLQGMEPTEVNSLARREEIVCRTATLVIRDELLRTVTPETALRFRSLVDDVRTGITVLVPIKHLDHFRRPR